MLTAASLSQAADPEPAKAIVKEKCRLCHGEEGEASSAIYPRLAGQNQTYLVKQLRDFRDGKRKSEIMNEMVSGLQDDEINALAGYFSSKPPLSHQIQDKMLASVGEYIFRKGNQYSGIPACQSCHGKNAEGSAELPRLAGQHKRYISDQLLAFGLRARTNDNAIMHTVASKLTELEREAVALYVSGIKPSGEDAAQ
ncbi:cytochrome c, class I [Thiolapillus brandeum]|uniref:Cytochrome c, class I n=1 Tax=Thiolapillus brandeum TaxID=1076588 RepID=A0A7U6GHP4_9GAMM|nr:cytochrome c, class I [Thiolapillus brandeum]